MSLSADGLPSNISNVVQRYDLMNVSDAALENVTSAVTDCLSSTCRHSRASTECYEDYCSPVKLLVNSMTPNVTAIHDCLNKLCHSGDGGYDALPYADTDIVGIGVWFSYILQYVLIVSLFFGFVFLPALAPRKERYRELSGEDSVIRDREESSTEQSNAKGVFSELASLRDTLLEEFHKAQCYFAATVMVASFNEGIYDNNLLIVFMLIPISLNGILPVVFGYFLLALRGRPSTRVTLLTTVVYLLSSVVYWSLFAQYISAFHDLAGYNGYEQFTNKLSAISACGGYSGLAVCPDHTAFARGIQGIERAGQRIHRLTPLIWTFSTVVLLAVLLYRVWNRPSARQQVPDEKGREEQRFRACGLSFTAWQAICALATAAFLAGMGMQLSLLSIATSLQMMDRSDWSFGQIVAVTIWAPPLVQCFYEIVLLVGQRIKPDNKPIQKPVQMEEL